MFGKRQLSGQILKVKASFDAQLCGRKNVGVLKHPNYHVAPCEYIWNKTLLKEPVFPISPLNISESNASSETVHLFDIASYVLMVHAPSVNNMLGVDGTDNTSLLYTLYH